MVNSRSGKYLHSPHQLLVLSRILNNILCARIRIIFVIASPKKVIYITYDRSENHMAMP
jgi:hypothetical protein